ncbi:MAG: prepilin-type N-terminal cleavage/methylation domain-containing protein [Myxococcales bacterium]|nr:prepilin-type N-terminal cleavage/methylation domain-containing protein [Myxococcales bacterium]
MQRIPSQQQSRTPARAERERGFTLLELLAALVVISIMMFASMSVLNSTTPNRELKRATNEIVDMISWARMMASQRNRAFEVVIVPVAALGPAGSGENIVRINESADGTCRRASFTAGNAGVRRLVINSLFPNTIIMLETPASLNGTGNNTFCIRPNGEIFKTDTSAPVAATNTDKMMGDDILYRVITVGGTTTNERMINRIRINYFGRVRTEVVE